MASSNHKVSIVVGVKDLASGTLRGIQNTLNHMGKGLGSAGNFMGAFGRNLDSVIGKMDRLANSMYKFNMYTSALQRNLRTIGLVGGAVAGGLAIQGTNKALDYDYKTRIMQSRMETNNGVRKNVSDYILNDLNYQTSYKPTELADMGILLGQGGVNNARDMKSMLKTTAYFSEAVDAVPQDAAEMVIAAAKGFNISMQNSGQITDKLTIALNKSLLHTQELPHAIGELSGRANMFGQSLDSSLVALMTMRDQGMSAAQGSQDFLHALRQASRIGNDEVMFDRTRGYFESLGVTNAIFNKDTRQLKEFPELIADMEKAMVNQGYVNPKYNVKDMKSFKNFLGKNGGVAPKDFWDSEKAMPLITRVFGAAGQAPILMGLQSRYDEIDKKTGEKTGNVFYGSEALKQMFKDVKNSDGAVDRTHEIIAQSGKFQLDVLSGAWESTQIKLLDGIVPLIKTGAEQLTRNFAPPKGNNKDFGNLNAENYEYVSPLDAFRKSLEETVDNFRKEGHTTTAQVVDTIGNGVVNGVEISKTFPSTTKQIGSAFNENMVKADWGDSLIEFPWHIVKNGIGFIKDIFKANEEFNAAVEGLPKDLQDPARLIATLVKGGLALVVTGAVVKVVELGIRGVSLALKGGKMATSLTEGILKMFTGKGGVSNAISKALGKNMAIKANIVNVYGTAINGGIPGKGGTPGAPPIVAGNTPARGGGKMPLLATGGLTALALGGFWMATHPEQVDKAVRHNPIQEQVEKLGPQTDKKISEMHAILKDPSKYTGPKKPGQTEIVPESNFFKPTQIDKSNPDKGSLAAGLSSFIADLKEIISLGKGDPKKNEAKAVEKEETTQQFIAAAKEGTMGINSSILDGFSAANSKLQNIKLNNALSIVVQPPQVNVTGVPQAKVTTSGSTSFTKRETQGNSTAWDRSNAIMQRRIGLR